MLRRFGVALLGVHAAIHLLGTMVYWKIGEPVGLAYRTELHGGLKIGGLGAFAFGGLWLLAAVLIAGGATGLHVGWRWWRPFASAGLALSLALTILMWPDAGWGAVLDVMVLPAVLVRRGVSGAGRGNTYGDRQGHVRPKERRGLKWTQGSVYGRL